MQSSYMMYCIFRSSRGHQLNWLSKVIKVIINDAIRSIICDLLLVFQSITVVVLFPRYNQIMVKITLLSASI